MANRTTEADLLDALERDVLVVLPNGRAARTLRQAYDARQRERGLRAWDAAGVLAWPEWMRSLWSGLAARGAELRLLLNAAQEHSLWHEIIEASTAGESLSSSDALADMASSAWSLAAAHMATTRIRHTATTFDSRTFAAWAESFSRICASERSVSAAQIEEVLSTHAVAGRLRLDRAVLLAGFEQLTPASAGLIESLRRSGAQIKDAYAEWPVEEPSRASTILPTTRDEIAFAARWIRQIFVSRKSDWGVPRIAVLLADAQANRAELESLFREILAPELQPIAADNSAAPWEFTAGAPSCAQGMVADALALLRLVQGPIPIERLAALLRSPFLGSSAERLAAARFDSRVLRREPPLLAELDLDGLTRLIRQQPLSRSGQTFHPAWLRSVNDVRARLRTPASRSYAEWAEVIRELLRSAGWPGDGAPTALQFATARTWDGTLDLLATLDFRGVRVSFAAAVKTLEQLLRRTQVSAPAAEAPIQILSAEQAEGSVFDAVILLHATEEAWPQPARLHPLLGWTLQRDLGLPGVSAARDAERALVQAESLLRRTPNVLVLSAAADERGKLRPSPLLDRLGIPFRPPESLLAERAPREVIAEEIVPDDVALPPLPSPELRGGANVLKLQAACAFQAFAEIRLNSAIVDSCELGLDAIERGNLVHRALEHFWTSTRSQSELRGLSSEERERRLGEAIDAAFAKMADPSPGWGTAYIRLQRERLRHLLSRWLDLELQRGPFSVRQREQRTSVPVGPLQLKVQPDRVDEVEGGIVLVDYKTGYRARPSDWDGDRPNDPQLPLYAVLSEPGELQGLFFGRVRPGAEMKWDGVAANQTVLPARRRQPLVDLDLRKEEWHSVLTALAEDFAAGRAEVNPKSFALNCGTCRQRLLCRVNPAALQDSVDEENGEEEIDV